MAIVMGLGILLQYKSSPGPAGSPPEQWPKASRIQPEPNQATLVVAVHPQCPCTQATLAELAWIMTRSQGTVSAYVLFLKPSGFAEEWVKSDLWKTAETMAPVKALIDEGGAETRLFQAMTSGQTLLYDQKGRLVFSGGITATRGHVGNNPGRRAIVAMLRQGKAPQRNTPVFGCSLVDPADCKLCQGGMLWKMRQWL